MQALGRLLDRLRREARERVDAVWQRDRAQLHGARALGLRCARVAILVARGIVVHRLKLLAGALTYCTVFSIVPLLVVVFMSLRLLDYIPATMPELPPGAQAHALAGNALLEAVVRRILEAVDRTSEITGGLVGLAVLLWAVVKLFSYTERALYIIAGSEQRTPRLRRLLGYVALLVLPPAVLAVSALLLAAAHGAVGARIFGALVSLPGFSLGVAVVAGVAALWLALALFYSASARARIAFSSAAVGGAVAAVTLPLVLWGFAELQIGASKDGALQSGIVAVPVFLLWLSSFWYVVLIGAEIAVAHGVDRVLIHGAATFRLDCLGRGQAGAGIMILAARAAEHEVDGGRPEVTIDELARELRLPPRLVRELCGRLVARGLLVPGPGSVALGCNPDDTEMAVVLDAVERDPELDAARDELLARLQPPAGRVFEAGLGRRRAPGRGLTLRELTDGPAGPPRS